MFSCFLFNLLGISILLCSRIEDLDIYLVPMVVLFWSFCFVNMFVLFCILVHVFVGFIYGATKVWLHYPVYCYIQLYNGSGKGVVM